VDFRLDHPLCREALNCSSLYPSGRFSSPFGRLSVFDQASGFLSKTQIWEDCCNCLDTSHHGPDVRACIKYGKLRASDQPSGRLSSWSGRSKPLYGNYLQRTCDRLDDKATLSECGSLNDALFQRYFWNFGRTVVHPNGAQFYQARRSFELSAYK